MIGVMGPHPEGPIFLRCSQAAKEGSPEARGEAQLGREGEAQLMRKKSLFLSHL